MLSTRFIPVLVVYNVILIWVMPFGFVDSGYIISYIPVGVVCNILCIGDIPVGVGIYRVYNILYTRYIPVGVV